MFRIRRRHKDSATANRTVFSRVVQVNWPFILERTETLCSLSLAFYWLGGGAMQAEDKTKLGPFISNRDSETLEAVNCSLSVYSDTENVFQHVALFHLLMSLSGMKWATD